MASSLFWAVNYDKSNLLVVGVNEDRANEFAKIFFVAKGVISQLNT